MLKMMTGKTTWIFTTVALAVVVCFQPAAHGQIAAFVENFESLDPDDSDALGNAGWLVAGNIYLNGVWQYTYNPCGVWPCPAPNDGGAFCQLATGEGGPDQGQIVLNTFNDYLNTDSHNNPEITIESNVYREWFIGADDLGQTWRLTFDFKASDKFGPAPPSTASAFVKVLDFVGGTFDLLAFPQFDTTDAPITWGSGSIELTIDPAWEGQLIQIGFLNTSQEYSPTGIFYDNIVFDISSPGTFVPPSSFNMFRGVLIAGALDDVLESDNIRMRFNPGFVINSSEAPVWVEFQGNVGGSGDFDLTVESQAGTPGLNYTVEMWNFNTNSYDVVGVSDESFNNDTVESYPIVPQDHVSSSGDVETRIGWRKIGFTINFPWETRLDQIGWAPL
jgi:hypothetical protein